MKPRKNNIVPEIIFFLIICVFAFFLASHIAMAYDLSYGERLDPKLFIEIFSSRVTDNFTKVEFTKNSSKVFALTAFILFLVCASYLTSRKKYIAGKEHGTSEWGEKSDIQHLFGEYKVFEKIVNSFKKAGSSSKKIFKKIKIKVLAGKETLITAKDKNLIFTKTEHISIDNMELNINTLIVGGSGSGKSFATKREIINVLLNDDKTGAIVIDPEAEYTDFCVAFGGEVIKISATTNNYINPLDMAIGYSEGNADPIIEKSDYIMSIAQMMLSVSGKITEITPQQKTMVDKALRVSYRDYIASGYNEEYIPTLMNVQDELDKERNTPDGEKLASAFEYYTRGSMNLFAHKSNVNYSNRFVVISIRDLGEQVKQIALMVALEFIWNRSLQNKSLKTRTYCWADEIHLLFDNDYSAKYLEQLYKRGRKYGLIITGITQNMERLLQSDMARGMIGNSDFILLLNQKSEDLKIVIDMLKLSGAQSAYIDNVQEGHGLLCAEGSIVPFSDKFPDTSWLYALMSTKFGEQEADILGAIMEYIENLPMPVMQTH